jgi:hypothetical protein
MKKTVILALSLVSSFALAHIELGTYTGKRPDGSECSFEVKDVSFKNDLHHPLNERVYVIAEGQTFELAHRPVLDLEKLTVRGESELLTAANGDKTGAWGARLVMGETADGEHGPASLTIIYENYKVKNKNSIFTCAEVKLQK